MQAFFFIVSLYARSNVQYLNLSELQATSIMLLLFFFLFRKLSPEDTKFVSLAAHVVIVIIIIISRVGGKRHPLKKPRRCVSLATSHPELKPERISAFRIVFLFLSFSRKPQEDGGHGSSFLLLRLLQRPAGDQNVHHRDRNGTSEAAEKGEWLFWGVGGLFCSITSSTGANFGLMPITCWSLQGVRQPGGRAQTRRAAVPQRGPVRGEMPEVKLEGKKKMCQKCVSACF